MNKSEIKSSFLQIRQGRSAATPALNKPILILLALARCRDGSPRLALLQEYEHMLSTIAGLPSTINLLYPFHRLTSDEIWEVEQATRLSKSSSGDLSRKEVNDLGIRAGLIKEIYDQLHDDTHFLLEIAKDILTVYIPSQYQYRVGSSLGFDGRSKIQEPEQAIYQPWHRVVEPSYLASITQAERNMDEKKQSLFITYLNSLHNVGASGANALAESQAQNTYFSELYEPFPIIKPLFELLIGDKEIVVVLTGHAGDGKSTVALDLLKRLKKIEPLDTVKSALKEREDIPHPNNQQRSITIIKDMSELSAERRLQWLEESFSEPGSWFIVSNTGPLLNSLSEYASRRHFPGSMTSTILERLNRDYREGDLKPHILDTFPKDLLILNMTRLDNVVLGAHVFSRMINHSGWSQCIGCPAEKACPLLLNRLALIDLGTIIEERVRWIYQRLNAYEHRLTLRQMVGHLAFALTGGVSCAEAKQIVEKSPLEGINRGTDGLERIIFSEAFFGYQAGLPSQAAGSLRAVELIRQQVFGAPVAVDFERQLESSEGNRWAVLPKTLHPIAQRWADRAREPAAARWRFAQRRMLYIFGKPSSPDSSSAAIFLDSFVQSPRLRNFDFWAINGRITLSPIERRRLAKSCLRVLLEVFCGFSSGQFQAEHDRLFLTLRRPDRAVVQPTQLVMVNLPFDDFHIDYDPVQRLPLLRYRNSGLALELTLPLLDFIERRASGDLGSELSEIHLAQLEWFRAELLRMNEARPDVSKITLLKANITGEVYLKRYHLDSIRKTLEID